MIMIYYMIIMIIIMIMIIIIISPLGPRFSDTVQPGAIVIHYGEIPGVLRGVSTGRKEWTCTATQEQLHMSEKIV